MPVCMANVNTHLNASHPNPRKREVSLPDKLYLPGNIPIEIGLSSEHASVNTEQLTVNTELFLNVNNQLNSRNIVWVTSNSYWLTTQNPAPSRTKEPVRNSTAETTKSKSTPKPKKATPQPITIVGKDTSRLTEGLDQAAFSDYWIKYTTNSKICQIHALNGQLYENNKMFKMCRKPTYNRVRQLQRRAQVRLQGIPSLFGGTFSVFETPASPETEYVLAPQPTTPAWNRRSQPQPGPS